MLWSFVKCGCHAPSIFVFPEASPACWGGQKPPWEYLGFQLLGRGSACTFVLPGLRAQRDIHDSATDVLLCHPQGADGIAGAAGPPGVQGLPVSSSLDHPALSLCLGVPEPRCVPGLPGASLSLWLAHTQYSARVWQGNHRRDRFLLVPRHIASKIQVWMNDVVICDSRIPLTTSLPRPRPGWFSPERGVERLQLTHAEATARIRRHIGQEDPLLVNRSKEGREVRKGSHSKLAGEQVSPAQGCLDSSAKSI